MTIAINCSCGAKFRAKPEYSNRRFKCTKCGEPVFIPGQPASEKSARHKLPEKTEAIYSESDNLGTRQDTVKKADAYWNARQLKPEKEPYLLYFFTTEKAARDALLAVPCIHLAKDTKNLICTETITFGFYNTGNGGFEAIVAGWELDTELFTTIRDSFRQHGGKPQGEGELAPSAQSEAMRKKSPSKTSIWQRLAGIFGSGNNTAKARVKFVRKYTQPNVLGVPCTYEIYKASDPEQAKDFLKTKKVSRQLHYVVVETPSGNWARDKDGMYQE